MLTDGFMKEIWISWPSIMTYLPNEYTALFKILQYLLPTNEFHNLMDSTPASYLLGSRNKYQPRYQYTEVFHGFPQFIQSNARTIPHIRQ
jgi:hypothetical protein